MKKIKILVVEDETIVALDIKGALKKIGFEVTHTATNHDDAISSIIQDEPNIILMDIHLENSKDGIETAKDIQRIKNIPIIYLSAFSDDETIYRAIETNPVGYLTKPFKREELKTTILLSMYKVNQTKQAIIDGNMNLGLGYSFNLDLNTLYYKQFPVHLTYKEGLLLFILIEARGSIVSFEELEHKLWPNSTVTVSALRTLIYRLRCKLEYKLVETIPSFGCKLTPIL